MLCGMSTEICKKCYVEEEGDVTRRRFGRSGWDKTMRKGRGQGEDSERAGRDKRMTKGCGQGEIENIGGEVKLGYNQVRREKIDPEILL